MMRARPAGVILIDLIILIVVFAGSLLAILAASGEAAKRLGENQASTAATLSAQRVIETVLALRRDPLVGYDKIPASYSGACSGFQIAGASTGSPLAGLTGTLACDLTISAYAVSPCGSAGVDCRKVTVAVRQNTDKLAELTVLLASPPQVGQ